MLNLTGVYECRADDKGRLMLPSPLKKQLTPVINEGFIIKRSVFHKCLELYPMPEWNAESGEVSKLNRFVKKNVDFIRIYMAGVKSVDLDNAGRLLIPKDLISFAGIQKHVVLSSAVNRIEVWDKEAYENVITQDAEHFPDMAEEVMGKTNSNNTDRHDVP